MLCIVCCQATWWEQPDDCVPELAVQIGESTRIVSNQSTLTIRGGGEYIGLWGNNTMGNEDSLT